MLSFLFLLYKSYVLAKLNVKPLWHVMPALFFKSKVRSFFISTFMYMFHFDEWLSFYGSTQSIGRIVESMSKSVQRYLLFQRSLSLIKSPLSLIGPLCG